MSKNIARVPKSVETGARKIKKAEPERIHTLGTEKCRNQSLKNRKTGARKIAKLVLVPITLPDAH